MSAPTVLLKSEETVCLVLKTAVSVETVCLVLKTALSEETVCFVLKTALSASLAPWPRQVMGPISWSGIPPPPLLSLVSESIVDSLSIPSDEIRTKTKQKAMGGGGGGVVGGGGGAADRHQSTTHSPPVQPCSV